LKKNVSFQAIQRLYEHLEKHHHPILEDGRFLAYKRVRDDFKDFYSGKFDNSIGACPKVDRSEVDDNHNISCSNGLHISSHGYAANHYMSGQGILVEVAVDPSHVVGIPFDYDSAKLRCTEYEVLSICQEERKEQVVRSNPEGFASDPDADSICPEHSEHRDFCPCNDPDNYCEECEYELNEDGSCSYCDDLD
jgi:hypothetical protein